MLKSQLSLCGTGLNHRRLQQSMLLSKTWKYLFSWIKMDSRKYSMYMFFFPIPEDVFILCISFFTDSGRCFWGRNYRFCILCIPSGLHIYIYILYYIIFTHAFLHISVQLQGGSILTPEMLGSILTAEKLVKNNFKGKHSNWWNAGKQQFQGENIPTAEMLV